MSEKTERYGSVVIERGVYTLGYTQTNEAGEVVTHREPMWRAEPTGGSVVVYPVSPEDREQLKPADIFSIWDCASVAEAALDALGLKLNLPDLADIWAKTSDDGVDLCDYCAYQGEHCENCYIKLKMMEVM